MKQIIKTYSRLIKTPGFRIFFFLAFVTMCHTSCEIINPDEEIPSYIYIEDIELEINDPGKEGSSSDNFTDAWVFIGNEAIGAFELPARIPILKKGEQEISIRAGIKLNGISATRAIYTVLRPYEEIVELKPAEIDTIKPKVSYFPAIEFPWIEGFESAGISLEKTSKSDTGIVTTADPSEVLEGKYSGVASLVQPNDILEVSTVEGYKLPAQGKATFLEFDYKGNDDFTVGVFVKTVNSFIQVPLVGVNPSEDWNRIYIDLTNVANRNTTAEFEVFFGFLRGKQAASTIYLDNIKLLHQ